MANVDNLTLIKPATTNIKTKIGYIRPIASTTIIVYIWCLPYLSSIGFAEHDGNSISEFIANAHATGALAALSFRPLNFPSSSLVQIYTRKRQNQEKNGNLWEFMEKNGVSLENYQKIFVKIYHI